MSILIKGMNMPTNTCLALNIYPDGRVAMNLDANCATAISVPTPHGRLIDADALKDVQQADADFFKGSSDYGEKCRYDEAINAVANIVNAPTIIEAEGEEE